MKYIRHFESKKFNEDKLKEDIIDSIIFGSNRFFDYLKKIIENHIDINFEFEDSSPLSTAVYSERIDFIKELIKLGADVNIPDPETIDYPLKIAADKNNYESVKILIEAGADLNSIDIYGNDVVHYLSEEFIEYIIQDYPEKYKEYLLKKQANKFNL